MEQEVCRVPPPVVAVGPLPVLGAALPPRLLILRRQARPLLAVRRVVALVRPADHPAEAAGPGLTDRPIFLMRSDGLAELQRRWPFRAGKRP